MYTYENRQRSIRIIRVPQAVTVHLIVRIEVARAPIPTKFFIVKVPVMMSASVPQAFTLVSIPNNITHEFFASLYLSRSKPGATLYPQLFQSVPSLPPVAQQIHKPALQKPLVFLSRSGPKNHLMYQKDLQLWKRNLIGRDRILPVLGR